VRYAIKRFFHDKQIMKAMFFLLAVDVLLVVSELLMDTQAQCVVTELYCGRTCSVDPHPGLHHKAHDLDHGHSPAHGDPHSDPHGESAHAIVFSRHTDTFAAPPLCNEAPLTARMELRLFDFLQAWHAPVHVLSIIICFVLLTECALVMLAEGPSHWLNPLYLADFLVLTFSLYCDVVLSHGAEGPLLLFVRVWRFARIFHALFMLAYSVEEEVVQEKAKKVADQFHLEQEALREQLRKARLQNDRLLREIRALRHEAAQRLSGAEGLADPSLDDDGSSVSGMMSPLDFSPSHHPGPTFDANYRVDSPPVHRWSRTVQ